MANPKDMQLQQRLHTVKLGAFENLEQLRAMVSAMEALHGIDERWTPESAQWKAAVAYIKIRDYQKALDKLEGLVVQRLFELTKMGLAGTGLELFLSLHSMLTKSQLQDTRCVSTSTSP